VLRTCRWDLFIDRLTLRAELIRISYSHVAGEFPSACSPPDAVDGAACG
jgi:hypothetical protein